MERRPTWAKNFRRFGFKSLRSHSWAPSWRRNASLATSLLMDPGLSPEAPCPSHLRVDQLFEALASSARPPTPKESGKRRLACDSALLLSEPHYG